MTSIVLDRAGLHEAVSFAAKTLPRHSSLAVLTGLRLTVKGGALVVSAFDYDTYSAAWIQVDCPDLDYLVPGSELVRYLAGMTDDLVTLDFGEHRLEATCGRMTATLRRTALESYPTPPDEPPHVGNVDAVDLIGALDSVRDCIDPHAGTERRRGYAVFLGSVLTIAGVHVHRCARRDLEWTGSLEAEAILPLSALEGARAFEDQVTIGYDEHRMSFSDADRQIITRLMQGQPDKIHRMFELPGSAATVRFDRAAMTSALKWIAVCDTRKEAHGTLRFEVGTDAVTLTLVGAETDATTTVAAKVEGDVPEMGWLARNLLSGLSGISANEVTLTIQGPKRAAMLTSDEDPTFQYVAMPVVLSS